MIVWHVHEVHYYDYKAHGLFMDFSRLPNPSAADVEQHASVFSCMNIDNVKARDY